MNTNKHKMRMRADTAAVFQVLLAIINKHSVKQLHTRRQQVTFINHKIYRIINKYYRKCCHHVKTAVLSGSNSAKLWQQKHRLR